MNKTETLELTRKDGEIKSLDDLIKGTKYKIKNSIVCGRHFTDLRTFSGVINGMYEFIKIDKSNRDDPSAINAQRVKKEDIYIKEGIVCYKKFKQIIYNTPEPFCLLNQISSDYQKEF